MAEYKVTFPELGNYRVPLAVLFREGLGAEYVVPPPITSRTLELGSRHSPDFVCSPFKYCLGNYIEAIEAGANTLLQVKGDCRLGYYGELHEQIIKDIGYEVKFVNMARVRYTKPVSLYSELKIINPDMSIKKIAGILPTVAHMIECVDQIEDYMRKNIGFEREANSFSGAHQQFLNELETARSKKDVSSIFRRHMKLMRAIPCARPDNPLRIGLVGEYYTIMVPFSNHFLEKELARMGIIIDRSMNVSSSLLHNPIRQVKERIKKYARYHMGATSMATIDKALQCAKAGYDGIIHVKSFGCTPEMDAIPVLRNISQDYKIPILYLSFDTQTSETGIKTRLEAFYDMIMMRKEAGK